MKSLVVFSHLRWDFMQQRPQHLLSRLAGRWPVIYIEEPLTDSVRNGLAVSDPLEGVQVWRPQVMGTSPGFHDDHLPVLRQLITDALDEHAVRDYWVWLYTPMALPLATALAPRGVVYDCVQDLSSGNASRLLVQRENALFKIADMVFAAGRSIYKAKHQRHPEVHFFPNSVDARHFSAGHGDHPLQARIAHPRLGYSGTLDERINLELIEEVAKRRPEWNIVMAGPMAGIDAGSLPHRDNLHWLGRQGYGELPALIAGWDVCLMPYSLNDATQSISPLKTLEYMACGKPVVSTSIRDVVEDFGQVLRIADTAEGVIADCEMLMQRTDRERQDHARALADVVAGTSWDATANAMAELIEQADDLVDSAAAFVRGQPAPDNKAARSMADPARALPQRAV